MDNTDMGTRRGSSSEPALPKHALGFGFVLQRVAAFLENAGRGADLAALVLPSGDGSISGFVRPMRCAEIGYQNHFEGAYLLP
jgi:hypothetical protein